MKTVLKNISEYEDSGIYARDLEYIRILDVKRYDAIGRMKNEINKKRLLAAGILLKDMCDAYGLTKPVISRTEHGKPYIEGRSDINFNLSHSGDYAAIAYGDVPVGLDIQEKRNVTESFARRILNDSEYGLHDPADSCDICRLWTVKEAYSKLLGLGLAYEFKNCIVDAKEHTVTDTSGRFRQGVYTEESVTEDVYMCCVVFG